MHIRNPVEWGVDQLRQAGGAIGALSHAGPYRREIPQIRRIGAGDLADALSAGLADFAAFRTDVIFLCVFYPIVGLILARLAFGYQMLPLLFPLASGFALVGPFAAVGLYEMSRRREAGGEVGWGDAFEVMHAPNFGAIVGLGLLLMAVFLLWLGAAAVIYDLTLGPEPPLSLSNFVQDVLTTPPGWTMIAVGIGVGFLFAVLVLSISIVSFPLLLDRDASLETAVLTSLRVVAANPGTIALWGLVVALLLALGSLPLFLGLIVVVPVLGHATWHLYRRAVPREMPAQRAG